MNKNFIQNVENKGIKDAEGLTIFITEFLEDPGIFFNLTESERRAVEKKMDRGRWTPEAGPPEG